MWLWCEVLTARCGVCVVVVVLKALAVADTLVLLIIFLLRSFRYVAPLVSRRPGPRHQEVPAHRVSTGDWHLVWWEVPAHRISTGAWYLVWWEVPTHRVSTGDWCLAWCCLVSCGGVQDTCRSPHTPRQYRCLVTRAWWCGSCYGRSATWRHC